MLAVDWANFAYAGAFVAGILVGVIVSLRLSKVLAQYLTDIRRRDRDDG